MTITENNQKETMKTKVTLVAVVSEPQLDEQLQRSSDTIAANIQIEEPQENSVKRKQRN